jgi:hypothetical protein
MSNDFQKEIEGIDTGRREALKKMVSKTSFVIPALASFSLGATLSTPAAAVSNSSYS